MRSDDRPGEHTAWALMGVGALAVQAGALGFKMMITNFDIIR
jgi:hypothetical protein